MLIARDTLKPIVLIRNIFYIISFDFIDLHINLMHKLTLITLKKLKLTHNVAILRSSLTEYLTNVMPHKADITLEVYK